MSADLASNIYTALRNTGQLHEHRLVAYRCEERCGLLDVVESPNGLIIGFPRHKTSPSVTTASSSAEGRARNTEDGDRKWRTQAGFIESVSRPVLSCDHVDRAVLEDADLRSDLDAGHTEVVVRRDGSRYAVC